MSPQCPWTETAGGWPEPTLILGVRPIRGSEGSKAKSRGILLDLNAAHTHWGAQLGDGLVLAAALEPQIHSCPRVAGPVASCHNLYCAAEH